MWMHCLLLALLLCLEVVSDFTVSDDQLYTINWNSENERKEEEERIVVKTANNETYSCLLPTHREDKHFLGSSSTLDLNNETTVLAEFFQSAPCIYKVDGYWTYELCHNKYIRQFRAEVTAPHTTVILKEYYLGYKPKVTTPVPDEITKLNGRPKSIHLNGKDLPYYSVAYNEGTNCDLTETPRTASVLYVCVEESQGDLFQVSELETCVYRVIVFTKHLCRSPLYGVHKLFTNSIYCQPYDVITSIKPSALKAFEKEKIATDQSQTLKGIFGDLHVKGLKVDRVELDGSVFYRVRTDDNEQQPESTTVTYEQKNSESEKQPTVNPTAITKSTMPSTPLQPSTPDLQAARAIEMQRFLSGQMCLTGGVGWWRHEVCFGKNITQYHEDENTKERSEIMLGIWDQKAHLDWLQENPSRKPITDAEKRKKVFLFYGQGAFCAEIETHRSVTLTLHCQQSVQAAVELSFSEPNTCQYSISLKSSLFCGILKQTDENGLL